MLGGLGPSLRCADAFSALFHYEIDQKAHLWVLPPAVRIEAAKERGLRRGLRQHFDEATGGDMVCHVKERSVGDAVTSEHPVGKHIRIVGVEPPGDGELARAIASLQRPEILGRARIAQQQAIVPAIEQVGGPLRRAVPVEIGGRGAKHAPTAFDPPQLEGRILRSPDKERHIQPLGHEVHHPVRKPHLNLNVGEPRDKLRHQRRDDPPPHAQRCREPHHPARAEE